MLLSLGQHPTALLVAYVSGIRTDLMVWVHDLGASFGLLFQAAPVKMTDCILRKPFMLEAWSRGRMHCSGHNSKLGAELLRNWAGQELIEHV